MLAENYYVKIVTRTQQGITITDYYYYYLEIIALQFNKDGKIEWVTKVPKYQYSINDKGIYSSYLMAKDKENLYLLYNDNPKNGFKLKKTKSGDDKVKIAKLNNISRATIMLATIHSNGELVREPYSRDKDKSKTAFVPSNYSIMSKDRIWVVGVKGKLRKYGFLTIKGNGNEKE